MSISVDEAIARVDLALYELDSKYAKIYGRLAIQAAKTKAKRDKQNDISLAVYCGMVG